jgi:hypothetical protein
MHHHFAGTHSIGQKSGFSTPSPAKIQSATVFLWQFVFQRHHDSLAIEEMG